VSLVRVLRSFLSLNDISNTAKVSERRNRTCLQKHVGRPATFSPVHRPREPQCTAFCQRDRRTDGQTDRQTDAMMMPIANHTIRHTRTHLSACMDINSTGFIVSLCPIPWIWIGQTIKVLVISKTINSAHRINASGVVELVDNWKLTSFQCRPLYHRKATGQDYLLYVWHLLPLALVDVERIQFEAC